MQHKRIFTVILISLLYTQIVKAQFPQNVTYQSIQPPNLVLPNYLDSITDASVPDSISIKRITQYDTNWNWYPVHDYAKIQPWNADASIYKFSAVAIYDAITHQMIRELPGGQIYPCYWSNTNPDLIYSFRESGYIRTYSVSADTVIDMNTDIQGYDIVKLGPGEGNIDNNDKYVALIGKSGSDMDVIVFDLQLNNIVHTETFAGAWGNGTDAPEYVDWVSVSQSGNYVGIMWNHNTTSQSNPFNNHYGVEIYNTTNMQYLRRIADYGNHGDFGYAQDGNEVFVQFWGPTGTLNMYYLNGNGRVVLSTNSDFDSEGHVSCRNINRPGYAYVSQDYQDHSGQIIAFKLDSSGLVEHFGHHFSTSSSYLKSPMPVPTPNGDKIMFKSDFGDSTADVIYVFESKLKSNVDNTLPIELTSFTAIAKNKTVDLNWITVSEKNNDYFSIERSKDGIHFNKIGTIEGANNSNETLHYYYSDANPLSGLSYYRIKQTDFDKKFTYSEIRAVTIKEDSELELNIYPNPATTTDIVNIILNKKAIDINLSIYNFNGATVYTEHLKQTNNIKLRNRMLTNGMYFIFINADKTKLYKRLEVK